MPKQKPLIEKLGIREGSKIIMINAPEDFSNTLGNLPKNVDVAKTLKEPLDCILFFTKNKEELQRKFPSLKKQLSPNGVLWIAWPKGPTKVATDLNENVVKEIGLRNGLVDVKVISVDEVWSGLKFVFRVDDRKR